MNPSPLDSLPFVERVFAFDEIDSTNTFALSLDRKPSCGLYVVTARRQTGGRGQRGNPFHSSVDGGLWVSLVVPLGDVNAHFRLNRSLALAACAALGETASLICRLKWPNDLIVGGRKIGGILLEASTRLPGVVVAGIGINGNFGIDMLPPELRDAATTVLHERGRGVDRDGMLYHLVRGFHERLGGDDRCEQEQYRRLLVGVGSRVTIGDEDGVFAGVDSSGRACLEREGTVRRFYSGPLRFAQAAPGTVPAKTVL